MVKFWKKSKQPKINPQLASDLLEKANQEMVLARTTMQTEIVESALLTGLPPLQLEVSEINTMEIGRASCRERV